MSIRNTQFWRSIFRTPGRTSDPGNRRRMMANLWLHMHPITIRRSATRWWFTWGMGWLCVCLFLIELITGIALMFYYRPTVVHAYQDIQALRSVVAFGWLREIHRWAAHAMVACVWLHMLRVFLTGSYKRPREFNWTVGVLLLVMTMLLSFTGYLLPWDQLSMWAVTVGTNMIAAMPIIGHAGPGSDLVAIEQTQLVHEGSDIRHLLLGSDRVTGVTLNRFYVLHCLVLPALTIVLLAVHFWRIHKDGGISHPLKSRSASTAEKEVDRPAS